MIFRVNFLVCVVVPLCLISVTNSVRAKESNDKHDVISDIANVLLQGLLANDQGGEMAGVAQAIGNLMKNDGSKSTSDGSGGFNAAQAIAGLSKLMNANNANAVNGDLDLAQIGNLIKMFTSDSIDDDEKPQQAERQKRRTEDPIMDNEIDTGVDSISNIASALMKNVDSVQVKGAVSDFLPMALQLMNALRGVDGDVLKDGKLNLQWILQLLPEEIKVLFNQFVSPALFDSLWQNSNIKKLFSVSEITTSACHPNTCLSFTCQTVKKVH